MCIFENNCKNRLSVGGSALEPLFAASGGWEFRPQSPALLLLPTITTLLSSFPVAFYYPLNEGTK